MADESGDYEVQELDPRVFQVPEFLPGQKVQITIGSTTKHAEVRFVGPLTGMKGFWLGVQYEDKASRDPPSLSLTHAGDAARQEGTQAGGVYARQLKHASSKLRRMAGRGACRRLEPRGNE